MTDRPDGKYATDREVVHQLGQIALREGYALFEHVFATDDPEKTDLLLAILEHHAYLRPKAAQRLLRFADQIRHRPEVITALVAVLDDPDRDARYWAVNALGRMRNGAALEPLIAHLADPDPAVRRDILGALGKLGDPRALDACVRCFDDPDSDVWYAALEALRTLKDERAISPLVALLGHSVRNKEGHAIWVLTDLRGERLTQELARLFDDPSPHIRASALRIGIRVEYEDHAHLRKTALDLLVEQDSYVLLHAIETLGVVGIAQDGLVVLPFLQHDDGYIRGVSARAIGSLKPLAAFDQLVDLAFHGKDDQKPFAYLALSGLPDPRILPLLVTLFEAPDTTLEQPLSLPEPLTLPVCLDFRAGSDCGGTWRWTITAINDVPWKINDEVVDEYLPFLNSFGQQGWEVLTNESIDPPFEWDGAAQVTLCHTTGTRWQYAGIELKRGKVGWHVQTFPARHGDHQPLARESVRWDDFYHAIQAQGWMVVPPIADAATYTKQSLDILIKRWLV